MDSVRHKHWTETIYVSQWPTIHGPVILPYILGQWPTFHGPLILYYILKSTWWINIVLEILTCLSENLGSLG